MNSYNCIGRLGGDPECRYFESGSQVASFSIAIDNGKDPQGNKRTTWLPVKAWNGTAKLIVENFHKGDMIGLSGELEQEKWEDRNGGGQRSKIILNARRMSFVGGNRPEQPQGHEPTENIEPRTAPAPAMAATAPEPDYDEIPF